MSKISKPVNVNLLTRNEIRSGVLNNININNIINFDSIFYGNYNIKTFVNYDVVICIPSHERYKKIKRLISQFYEQESKYSFKIILLNDGSKNNWYNNLIEYFPDIIYLKNEVSNGKINHWYSYNQMWEQLKNIECHAVLQMDDDFILSDNFLDNIMDIFFREKQKNNQVVTIAPHTWSFNKVDKECVFGENVVDGIGLFDIEFIKALNYELRKVYNKSAGMGQSAGVWNQLINIIKNNNCLVYRTEYSLVWHDGNEDSKLHGDFRKKKSIYTQNYINKTMKYD